MLEASGGAPITCCCARAPLQAAKAIEINAIPKARLFILFHPKSLQTISALADFLSEHDLAVKPVPTFPDHARGYHAKSLCKHTLLTCNHLVAYYVCDG